MKTTITSLCLALSLTLGASAPALADHRYYDGGYRDGYYAPPSRHHHGGHYRGNGWVGPAAILAVTGIAAGIAASVYYAPRPVYVAPPPVYLPPPRPVYVVPARAVYAVPPQPVYGPPPGGYWAY